MKKLLSLMFVAIAISMNSCTAQEKIIRFEQLPAKAQEAVKTYFNIDNISYVKAETEFTRTAYEVVFNDGSSLDFNTAGDVEKVDCKRNQVPDGLIPAQILTYIQTNHPNNFITEYKKERSKYEVELNNGLDLIFNKNLQFVGIDN